MPAPDLPPPPSYAVTQRPLAVHFHPRLVAPESLTDAVVIVIDNLRATVTIAAALANGAKVVVPTLSVEDAHSAKDRLIQQGLPSSDLLLGGERGGVLIPGFDLDNSPTRYTRDRVAGKTIIFTTTNGTAALLHAGRAASIIAGSFSNLTAVARAFATDPRPVHILCAGTRDEIGLDDVLPAGAFTERFLGAGRRLISDDSGRVALHAYRGALRSEAGLLDAMRTSRGGRNLAAQGLGSDIEFCTRLDALPVVPVFDPALGEIRLAANS